jgi:integrase
VADLRPHFGGSGVAAEASPESNTSRPTNTGWFRAAVKRAGVQAITPHDLRHTCASLAVGAGVNVLALARMLEHTDPSVTLRVYADLFDTDLDAVAERLHSECAQSVPTGCPGDPKLSPDRALTSAKAR